MTHDLILTAHIAAGAVLMGETAVAPFHYRSLKRAPVRTAVRSWLDAARRHAALEPAAAMALLVTGVVLGGRSVLTSAWLLLSLVAWLLNSGLAVLVVGRGMTWLDGTVSGTPEGESLEPALTGHVIGRAEVGSWIMAANDIAVLWLMVAKPDTIRAIQGVVIVHATMALIGMMTRRT